jgi:hypothetical protein
MPQAFPTAIFLRYILPHDVRCDTPNRNKLTAIPQKNTVFPATCNEMRETNRL